MSVGLGLGLRMVLEIRVGNRVGSRVRSRLGKLNLGVVVGVEDCWMGIEGTEERVGEVEAGGADCFCWVVVIVVDSRACVRFRPG